MLRRVRRVVSVVVLLALWQLVSSLILPRIAPYLVTLLPSPLAVLDAFIELTRNGDLFVHAWASLKRIAGAFTIAAAIGIPLGLAIGWWPRFGALVDPLIELVRPIPPLAWIPIAILWFGLGNMQNMFIIFLGAFFPIVINTIAGVRGVDRTLIAASLTLGGSERQILYEIVLPGSAPMILTGLRIGLGVGWMSLVAAELVAATSGLGFLIEDSRNLLATDYVIFGMALIGILGSVMDRGMRFVQHRLTPWTA
jgi:NitT/TauT family transport system permease protein/taurine transport system permease protein